MKRQIKFRLKFEKMWELNFLLILIDLTLGSWQDGVGINSYLSKEKLDGSQLGKFQNYEYDHLSLMAWNTNSVLIGGRDALFNLSSQDLKINSILNWTVSPAHQEMCQVKGQKDSDCHNFIRVFHGPIHHHHPHLSHHSSRGSENTTEEKKEEMSEKWIICGTNAFKPLCRLYNADLQEFSHEISGVGYSPFDPAQGSTSLLHHGAVYAATVADFGGSDALIYKNPLRTEQYDSRHLSNPTFVSSASYGDSALFFFRELAVEHTNCGKAIFSRVARICRHDSGSKKHKDRFTTFLKARLNCSVPGEFPFYFDHIQGTTSVFVDSARKIEMLYAVFTTGENSIGASAICAFKMNDILNVFNGPFKGQASDDSNWLPVPPAHVPAPRPGSCHAVAPPLPDAASVAFHKAHPLMDESVHGALILVHTSNEDRFRAIEVDPSEDSDPLTPIHILYVGTHSGKVLKVIVDTQQNVSRQRRHGDSEVDEAESTYPSDAMTSSDPLTPYSLNSSMISASWQVSSLPIKTLKLVDPTRLLVATETDVVLLPTAQCAEYKTCADCIKVRDPHCFWDMMNGACVRDDNVDISSDGQFDLRQDIENGDTQFCPEPTTPKPEILETKPTDVASSSTPSTKGDECCACPVPTTIPPTGYNSDNVADIGDNNIPELDGHFRYAGGSPANFDGEKPMTFDTFKNGINRVPRKEHEPSSVQSINNDSEMLNRTSTVAMATVGSAFIALLIGFSIGFTGSRWLSKKQNLTKTAATNAQLAACINEQSQRLTSKPIDFTLNMNNWNGGGTIKNSPKINLNTDTLEKTVKKIYI